MVIVEVTCLFTIFSICACLYLVGNKLMHNDKGRENERCIEKEPDGKKNTQGYLGNATHSGKKLKPGETGNQPGNIVTKGTFKKRLWWNPSN